MSDTTDTTDPTDADVQIAFEQFQQPGLKDGQYTVSASVAMSDPTAPTFPAVQKILQVGTDDVALPAGSIVSVFPPDNGSGEYTGCLPHVLLNRATIPWQKQLKSGAADKVPWLAVLSISAAELAATGGPTLAQVQKNGATANVLRMTRAFFRTIAPTAEELSYLAHVRKVETTRKADATVTEVDYAVVVGNRLPQPGTETNAYLVSLAEQGELLPGGNATTDPIELTVLRSWRFFTIDETQTFADVILATERTPPTLGLPATPGTDAGNLLAMGYVPMPHALRVGGTTISLYRGPLVPFGTRRKLLNLPIENADAVSFYDPTTGILDASCSAAWTLGRLLTLNAASCAVALYNWKRAAQRDTIDRLVYEFDTGTVPAAGSVGASRRSGAEHALAAFLPAALSPLSGVVAGTVPAATAPRAAHVLLAARPKLSRARRHAAMQAAMTNPVKIAQLHGLGPRLLRAALGAAPQAATASASTVDSNLKQVVSWLADLNLLKHVPLNYLVPDERMLPSESIRFFQVDQSWMEALIDGAMSIGRVTEADLSHDTAFLPTMQHELTLATAAARDTRSGALGSEDDPPPPARPVSGFLLRSSAVTQWPGMEVEASGPSGPAKLLRLEAQGTLLIGLFDALIDTVTLHEPPEGVHFGFDVNGTLSKNPRRLTADGNLGVGTEIVTSPPTPLHVSYRAGAAVGVLDIKALADALNTRLSPPQFTSAEFALEMVAGVQLVTFTLS